MAVSELICRARELSAAELENLMTVVANPQKFKVPYWFLNTKDCKDGRYSQAVSNALDMKLRDDVGCLKNIRVDKLQHKSPCVIASWENLCSRRLSVLFTGTSLVSAFTICTGLILSPVKAEEKNAKEQEEEGDSGVIGAITSLFDPNEKTKSGKVLPKGYLKAAREVIKTLRESLGEDTKVVAKFRRSADAAKESIREYLTGWRGQKAVAAEESYIALEKAIRSLANFYSKAGPFATLSEEIKSSILNDLNTAEASL